MCLHVQDFCVTALRLDVKHWLLSSTFTRPQVVWHSTTGSPWCVGSKVILPLRGEWPDTNLYSNAETHTSWHITPDWPRRTEQLTSVEKTTGSIYMVGKNKQGEDLLGIQKDRNFNHKQFWPTITAHTTSKQIILTLFIKLVEQHVFQIEGKHANDGWLSSI